MASLRTVIIRLCFLAFSLIIAAPAPAETLTAREYPYIYKSPRAMGMGGAYTAVGGRTDTLFYNPAGLSSIPRDKGWDVTLLKLSVETGKNSIDFYEDLQDALDTGNGGSGDKLQAVNEVLAQYRGENLHLRLDDFTAMGKNGERLAFGIGGVGGGRFDAIAHQGFSGDGWLELNADTTYGGISGFSFAAANDLFIGMAVKALTRDSVSHKFTAREMVEHQDDLNDYVADNYQKSGSAVGFDAGLIWKFAQDSWWRPSIGLSALNIGDLDFGEAGVIPMTMNAGIAFNPRITWFRSLTIAADYVDVTGNYTEDEDRAKRIRYGAEVQLFDKLPVEMALRAGMYEGYPTFGADLRLLVFTLSYTMYSEELGAYAGQDKDTRQLLTLNVGW